MSVFLVSPCSLFFFASLLFCVEDSVILLFRLGATPPPRAPCEPEVRVFPLRVPLRVVFILALMLTYVLFSSLPSHFRFRLGHLLFHPVFFLRVVCCLLGFDFCCDSFSISYIYYMFVRKLISPFISVWGIVYDLFQLLCVLSSVFICFLLR